MSRHDIQMTWDYAEANPFGGQAASWHESHRSVVAHHRELRGDRRAAGDRPAWLRRAPARRVDGPVRRRDLRPAVLRQRHLRRPERLLLPLAQADRRRRLPRGVRHRGHAQGRGAGAGGDLPRRHQGDGQAVLRGRHGAGLRRDAPRPAGRRDRGDHVRAQAVERLGDAGRRAGAGRLPGHRLVAAQHRGPAPAIVPRGGAGVVGVFGVPETTGEYGAKEQGERREQGAQARNVRQTLSATWKTSPPISAPPSAATWSSSGPRGSGARTSS